MATVIKNVLTSENRRIDVKFDIRKDGVIKRIALANKSNSLFFGEKIKKLVLPEVTDKNKPITGIGESVFSSRNKFSIEKLVIPNSFTIIESFAFKKAKVKKVVWPASAKYIPAHCFVGSEISHIENIENITTIEEFAFEHCYFLNEFIIPDNVNSVEDGVFSSSGVKHVRWSSNAKVIPKYCFYSSELNSIDNIEQVEHIGAKAFLYCSYLTTFNIPDSVETIDNGAFQYSGIITCKWNSKCSVLPENCFESSKLEKITNLDNCVEIGKYAFSESNIEEFFWPTKATKIQYDTFGNCEKLKSIYGIENVEEIESAAFLGTGLSSFTWPEKCHVIPSKCFSYCTKLKEIIISRNTGSIEINNRAFFQTKVKSIDLSSLLSCRVYDDSIKVKYPYYCV